MKKSIFALLFLLLLLIVTCVYQKTYTLYEEATAENNTTVILERKIETISPKKEQQQATKNNVAVISERKTSTVSPQKEHTIEKRIEKEKSSREVKKLVSPAKEKNTSKEPTFLEKVKATVTSVMTSEKQDVKTTVLAPNSKEKETIVVSMPHKQSKLNTKEEETEVVDYLLSVIDEQNASLAHRDEAEDNLHALIKRVLENRRLAIENMEKASLEIDNRQQERLKERDTMSQNHTKKEGK